MRRWRIGLLQCLPVLLWPAKVGEPNVADPPIDVGSGWHGQPLNAVGRLDAIAIAPVVFCVLDIVVKDEHVDVMDDVEVSLPRDVVRLQYGGAHQASAC